jgi:hypothetical protein
MPNRSKASRSNQLAPGQISITEGTTGNSSSSQNTRTRRRGCAHRQQVIDHGEARPDVPRSGASSPVKRPKVAFSTPRLKPSLVASVGVPLG